MCFSISMLTVYQCIAFLVEKRGHSGFFEGKYRPTHKVVLDISNYPLYREYNIQDPLELLKTTPLKYALTTYYAESLTQHYLFPSRVDIYVQEQDLEAWHTLLTKNGLVGKGNTRILLDDEHVFYANQKKTDYRIVSTPQLILDLLREQGVAIEAAHMLMKKEYHDLV